MAEINKLAIVLRESFNTLKQSQGSLLSKNEAGLQVIEKFGNIERFAIRFNPDFQTKLKSIGAGYIECFELEYPTLAKAASAYSNTAISTWLSVWIDNFNDFVGVKEKLTTAKINELAQLIFFEAYFLRISELALFFNKLKSGHYGEFYGVVDPLKIMVALGDFLKERNEVLHVHQRKLEEAEKEKERIEYAKIAVSRDEYLLRRKRIMSLKKKRCR